MKLKKTIWQVFHKWKKKKKKEYDVLGGIQNLRKYWSKTIIWCFDRRRMCCHRFDLLIRHRFYPNIVLNNSRLITEQKRRDERQTNKTYVSLMSWRTGVHSVVNWWKRYYLVFSIFFLIFIRFTKKAKKKQAEDRGRSHKRKWNLL